MKKSTLFVGLDDHKDSIEVAVAEEGGRGEVRRYGSIPHTPEAIRKLMRQLGRPGDLHFVYEAGCSGYALYRVLVGLGANCAVVAPSQTPRRPGCRIKNDRRDAATLARLDRAGELRRVWVPDEGTEAMRDLLRAREDSKYAQSRARQRLGSFLLRHGRRYSGRSSWTKGHLRWISGQRFAHPSQELALEEYLATVEEATQRIARLDQQIRELVVGWPLAPVVKALSAHRGVSLLVAATVVAELGDLTRFDRAQDLMAFVGLVPSLEASGATRRSGAITKTGNGHVRRVLIQAAWAFRHPARRTAHLRQRLEGQPPEIRELSWKAQVRLCGKYRRLRARGKEPNKVVTAVARELVGFLWATAALLAPVRKAA